MAIPQAISARPGLMTSPADLNGTRLGVRKGDSIGETVSDFEAMFLSLLLKEMRQTLDDGGGLFPGDTGDIQGGLFDQYLGKHLADAGGVGLAAALERQMNSGTNASGLHADRRTMPGASLR